MEGLEISEINYSEIERKNRCDSEFFKKVFLASEKYIRRKHVYKIGRDYKITDGEHGSVILKNQGIKYLTAENIKNGYIDINNVRYVDETVNQRNKRAEVKTGDLLISIKGTLGEVAVAEDWLIPANMNRDVAILKPKNKSQLSSYLLSSFLMCKYGRLQSQRGGSGGVQQMVTLDRLRNFIIPMFSSEFDKAIEEIYTCSLFYRTSSLDDYIQAENLLLETLGLADFQPSREPVNIKSFSESFGASGRLDAEYYQLKYEDIQNHIFSYEKGYTTIRREFLISKQTFIEDRSFYNYTEISDVNVADGSVEYNLIAAEDLPANGKLVLKNRQIIISKVRPYRGAVGIIRDVPDNYVGSGAFTVLSELSSYKLEVLQVLLRSKPYRELIMKYNVGSSYPVVKDEDILELPIPKINFNRQKEISDLVEESFKLKKQSEHLLEVAKTAVEKAIEQDEETAINYINQNIN